MSFSSDSKEQISLKKLVGKAHTKNESEFYNESKKSGITINANTVFAEDLPSSPGSGSQYQVTSNIVEYVRLPLTPLQESVQNGRYHAFSAALPSTYENSSIDPVSPGSSNPNKGNGIFDSDAEIHASLGKIQLVPNSFGDVYEVKVFNGGDDETLGDGSRIPVLDDRKWYFDYFNGILFQQNPPELEANDPDYIEAFVYIGKMASDRFSEGSGGGGAASLNELSDVTLNSPSDNHFLVSDNSGNFSNRAIALSDLPSNLITSSSSISDLSDVDTLTDIEDGNVLAWVASNSRFEFTTPAVTYTDEDARNATATALTSGTHTGITFLNDDANNQINATVSISSFSVGSLSDVDLTGAVSDGKILKWSTDKFVLADDIDTNTQLSDEEVQDIVGAMVEGNTETDIAVTYDDNNGKINFSVDNTIARIASPTFTGTPLVPTADPGTNTTQIASTAFVNAELASYQPLDAALTSISGLTTEADKLIYTTASDTYAVSTLTDFARSLLDDSDASTMISTLGLGSAALQDKSAFLLSSSTLDNLNDISITSVTNAQILVYDDDSGDADDKWKNVSISGDITINNAGVTTISENAVTNAKIANSFIDISAGENTDRLNLGETLIVAGTDNEIEVTITSDVNGNTDDSTLTIGLPDNVTIGGNLTVSGELTINGDATSIVTTNLDVTDSIISLNNGIIGDDPDNNPVENPSTRDIGFFLDRGSLDPALIFWDEADDLFKLGTNSGNIDSTSSDLADVNFSYSILKIASPKDVQDNLDLTSNDNTAATTEWTTSKISAIGINDLSDVDTTGLAEGKVLKFNATGELIVGEQTEFVADTSSLWEIDPSDSNNIYPHGIIDGTLDTGMFAIELSAGNINLSGPDTTIEDIVSAIQNMNAYTYTTRTDAEDAYWEFVDPANGNYDIQPKDF